MFLLFNMLFSLVITFLPRSKQFLISWLQSPSAVILEPKKIKSVSVSIVSPSICHEVMGPDARILVFWMLSFKPALSLFSFTLIKRLFSPSSLSAIRVVSSAYLRLLIFLPAILIQAKIKIIRIAVFIQSYHFAKMVTSSLWLFSLWTFYQWRNWGAEKLNILPKVTQLENDKARTPIRQSGSRAHVLKY